MSSKKPNKRVSPNEVYSYLISKGLSVPHAVGMLANIKHESNFVPTETGDNGTSAGLFMHHNDRYDALKKFTGGDLSNWKKQIDYALTEPVTKKYLAQKFSRPEEASYWFTTQWERPANAKVRAVERQSYVKEFLNNRGKNWDAPLYNPEGLTEEEIYASNMPAVEGEYQTEVPADVLAQQQKRDQEVEDLRAENKRLSEKEDEETATERERLSKEKQELLAAEEEQMKQTQFADALAEVKPQAPYQEPTEDVARNPELYQQNLGFEVQQAQNLFQGSIPNPEVQEAKYGGYFEDGGIAIPVIEDMGDMVDIPDLGSTWVPNWDKMAAQAKKLGAKKVRTRSGAIIEFDDNWKPITSDDNPSFEDGGEVDDSAEFNNFYQSLPTSLQSEDNLDNLHSLWVESGKVNTYDEIQSTDNFDFERQVLEYGDGGPVSPVVNTSGPRNEDNSQYYSEDIKNEDLPLSSSPSYRAYTMGKTGAYDEVTNRMGMGSHDIRENLTVQSDPVSGYNYFLDPNTGEPFKPLDYSGDKSDNIQRFLVNVNMGDTQTKDFYSKTDNKGNLVEGVVPSSGLNTDDITKQNIFKDLYTQNLAKYGNADRSYYLATEAMRNTIEPQFEGASYRKIQEGDDLDKHIFDKKHDISIEQASEKYRQEASKLLIQDLVKKHGSFEKARASMSYEDFSKAVENSDYYKNKIKDLAPTYDDYKKKKEILKNNEFNLGGTFDKLLDPNNITAFKQKHGIE